MIVRNFIENTLHRYSGLLSHNRLSLAIHFQWNFAVGAMSCQTQPNRQSSSATEEGNGSQERKERPKPKQLPLKDLTRVVNLSITDDSTPYCATVIHPGLSPESTGFTGKPSLQTLLKTAGSGRVFAMNMPIGDTGCSFFEYDRMTAGSLTFFASTIVNISRRMYDLSVPKWPLEIKVQGGHIGRTSISLVSSLVSQNDPMREELMKQVGQMVLIDKTTRRPKPIEDKYRNLYQSHCIRGEPLIVKRQEVAKTGPLSIYEVRVSWSDTDAYRHTNYTSYVRYAMDAIYDALHTGKLGEGLTEGDLDAGISQAKIAFIGECVEGDLLKVQLWYAEDSERTIVCSMEKDETVINQVTLSFYSA